LEKQQDLIDKQKDLNETLYGSSNYKSSLDPLYNYQTAIDTLQESIDELKESLEDLNGQDPSALLDQLFEKTHAKGA
jgi:prefoldin subunit 5